MKSSYIKDIHRSGRIWFVAVYFFIYLFPLVSSIYFNAWPTWKQLLGAAVGVIPIYWTVGIVEYFTYTPMLGAGGSYLGFITGNMSNLKVPLALNAMESMGVKADTEEGDVCLQQRGPGPLRRPHGRLYLEKRESRSPDNNSWRAPLYPRAFAQRRLSHSPPDPGRDRDTLGEIPL